MRPSVGVHKPLCRAHTRRSGRKARNDAVHVARDDANGAGSGRWLEGRFGAMPEMQEVCTSSR